jgi:hypothetical protein
VLRNQRLGHRSVSRHVEPAVALGGFLEELGGLGPVPRSVSPEQRFGPGSPDVGLLDGMREPLGPVERGPEVLLSVGPATVRSRDHRGDGLEQTAVEAAQDGTLVEVLQEGRVEGVRQVLPTSD